MPTIAFATHASRPDIEPDDAPLAQQLELLGYKCVGAPWNSNVDWTGFDGVVLRSTWDYHRTPKVFEKWLKDLESAGLPVWNPVSTLRWNMHKGYLLELAEAGVAIIPTALVEVSNEVDVAGLMSERGWNRVVIKPANSLGADDTSLITFDEAADGQKKAERILVERDLLIQRYQPQIESEGEWSLIFIDGQYSHAVLKRPPVGEFRAQEHLGASFDQVQPADSLVTAAEKALKLCGKEWAYARVDGVVDEGQFLLMELELLEPTLFFADNPKATKRLAKRINSDLKE